MGSRPRRRSWSSSSCWVGLTAAVVPSLSEEVSSIEPTLTTAFDDIEDWFVDDSPFDVSRETVDRLRDQTGRRVDGLLSSSDGAVLDNATLVAEVLTGLLLTLAADVLHAPRGRPPGSLGGAAPVPPIGQSAVERATTRPGRRSAATCAAPLLLGVARSGAHRPHPGHRRRQPRRPGDAVHLRRRVHPHRRSRRCGRPRRHGRRS